MWPRSELSSVLGCVFGWLCAAVGIATAEEINNRPVQRPSIVLILADDLGYGELGCYGQALISTPHLDRLAEQGVRLTQHYAGAPVCAPSRCVLLTGKDLSRAQIRDNRDSGQGGPFPGQWPLAPETTTIASVLRQAGYTTGVFGKWGLGPDGSTGSPLDQGFDQFLGYDCQRLAHSYYPPYLTRGRERIEINHRAVAAHQRQPEGNVNADDYRGDQYASDLIVDAALAFIELHADRPFFVYLPLLEPHLAMHPPQSWIDVFPLEWDDEHGAYRGQNGYLPHPRPRAAYAAMISHLDHHVGRVLEALDRLGLSQQTLVVFTSDNGPTHGGNDARFSVGGAACEFFQSTGGLRGYKRSCYEGGLRVPCIARWPERIPAGSVADYPSSFADWFSTLCAAASCKSDVDMTDGINLLPVLDGTNSTPPRHAPLIWEFHGYGGWIALRMGKWKAVRRNVKTELPSAWELYDLDTDPGETQDLAIHHEEIVSNLELAYRQRRTVEPDFPWPNDQESITASDDGWIDLFDGQTLDGWTIRGGQATYAISDGCIVGQTAPNSPNTFLCTDAQYDDFVLELEFLVDAQLNSGVQIRSQSLPEYRNGVVHGYQVEIDPSDRGWTGGLYDESRRGWLHDLASNRSARYAFRPGQWNHLRVVAVSDRLKTWVNHVPAADLRDAMTLSGFIGLQVHGVGARQDPLQIRFRKIRLHPHPTHDDFRDPVSPGESPGKIFAEAPEIEMVVDGLRFGEGPAIGPRGDVYFSDIPRDRILVWDPENRQARVFREPSGKSNGLFFTTGGRLLACESDTRVVSILDGDQRRVLAERYDGRRLNSPNDLVPDGAGGFYFTDPRYGDRQDLELSFEGVFYVDIKGQLSLVEDQLTRPNGIEMSPDYRRLYIADHAGGAIWLYDVMGPGKLENKRPFAEVGSDGMTVDVFGNLFVTWGRDVIVFSPDGLELDRLALPTNPTNCALLGSDLYITTPQALYRVRTLTRSLLQ